MLPSTLLAPLEEEPPADTDKEQMDEYYDALYAHLERVHQSTGEAIHDSEQRIRKLLREQEAHLVAPSTLFHFQVGQQVIRRQKRFSKIMPRASLPYTVTDVGGQLRQRLTLQPT